MVTDSSTGVGSCTLIDPSNGTNWGYCKSDDCLDDRCSVRSVTANEHNDSGSVVTLEANYDSECKNLQEF